MAVQSTSTSTYITAEALLEHWQGHRALTRRVIRAFPDDQLFSFSIGGMRPFAALAMEMLGMAVPMVRGIVTGEWGGYADREARSKDEILELWDDGTKELNDLWPQIPTEKFQETINAFGQYEGHTYDLLLYVIDNEIHHRGQGYVYLRALGIDPPPFYERS
ncbi:MAG: DinB family protein [Longimicrobiales bacterium]